MSNPHHITPKPQHTSNCIEDMDALLDQIDDFSELLQTQDNVRDNHFQEEWSLFKTYIKWKVEELTEYSYITKQPDHNRNS